jgi:hypothetical protein
MAWVKLRIFLRDVIRSPGYVPLQPHGRMPGRGSLSDVAERYSLEFEPGSVFADVFTNAGAAAIRVSHIMPSPSRDLDDGIPSRCGEGDRISAPLAVSSAQARDRQSAA